MLRGAPEPLRNSQVATDIGLIEVDLVWPNLRLCVEVDGPTHDDAEQQARDARRAAALTRAGFLVLNVHWAAWAASRDDAVAPVLAAIKSKMNATW